MANETMFLASAVTSTAAIALCVYLHHKAEGRIWKSVWLGATILMVVYSFEVMRRGWQNYVVDNALANLAFGFLDVFMWIFFFVLAATFWNLLIAMFDALKQAISGRLKYEPKEKKH